jgi:hypothetical protein
MHPTDKAARVAGLLYPLMGIPAVFSLIYIPRTLIVRGDAAATANNILTHEMLFRLGIVGELFCLVAFLFLAMALYRLLSGVNKTHASLMVILVLVSVAIGFVNVVNNIDALTLFRGADFLAVFDKHQLDALGMLFLHLHSQGIAVNDIFWGLWLFPFGVLVMRSGFLPRILGLLLIVNCFAYVAASLTSLLLPSYANVVSRAILPALLGELWIMLWLLIKGAKVQPLAAPAH